MDDVSKERLKKSRQRITIEGESRVAYGRNEVSLLTGIPEQKMRAYEELSIWPPSIFLWQEPFFSGHQLTLLYAKWREIVGWDTVLDHWSDPDTEEDLWPRHPLKFQ